MTRKIIKLKEGDTVPEGAKFFHTEQVKEKIGERTDYGLLWHTVYNQYQLVRYFYYEIEVES